MDTKPSNKTTKFVEVEIREDTEADPKESNFYFKCTTCHNMSLATNGHLVLKNPMEPMSDPKSYETNYIFCPNCEMLENMEGKEYDSQVFIANPGEIPKGAKEEMTRKIRDSIFS